VKIKIMVVVLGLFAAAGLVGLRTDAAAAEVDARYTTAASHFATLEDGTRLHYLEQGAKDAPTLVLIHGSFDSAFTWERVLPALAREFHVIAPDLPAHGLTGQTKPNRYAMTDMVQAVHGLVEHLRIDRFDIAGNSMGGNTAWLYALAHPERLRRMVLIDAAGYPTTGAPLVDANPNPVKAFFYRYGNPSLLVRSGLLRAVADPKAITDAYASRSVDFVLRAGARDAQQIRNRVRALHKQPLARMHEIATPTLIVWGDKDQLLPVAAAPRFHADLPNSTLQIYKNCGHMPQLEAPERLVKDLRAFLLQPAPTSAPATTP